MPGRTSSIHWLVAGGRGAGLDVAEHVDERSAELGDLGRTVLLGGGGDALDGLEDRVGVGDRVERLAAYVEHADLGEADEGLAGLAAHDLPAERELVAGQHAPAAALVLPPSEPAGDPLAALDDSALGHGDGQEPAHSPRSRSTHARWA